MTDQKLTEHITRTLQSLKKKVRRRELFNRLKVKDVSYEDFKRILTEMEQSGAIVKTKGRHYTIPEHAGIFTGVFTSSRRGGGTARTSKGDSLYIIPGYTAGALTGDTVNVRLVKKQKPGFSPAGEVVSIVERTTRPVIGIIKRVGSTVYIVPRNEEFYQNLLVENAEDLSANEGDLVVANVRMPVRGFSQPVVIVTEVLGNPEAPGMDVEVIARMYQLPIRFPESVLKESETITADLTPELIGARKDLRSLVTFTIDPEDAKDFDDAISISRTTDGGFTIGIHIADVSHYVRYGSAMDSEAISRGMSCYLVDRVIPMLPERLSNDLCSLKPGEDRLTKSVSAVLNREGEILSYEVVNSVIHSAMRLTYIQVQAFLEGRDDNGAHDIEPDVGESLKHLSELTDILVRRREKRGALDFEIPEARVFLDDKGKPTNIVKRDRFRAHRMVEEAMLLANTVTAQALGNTPAHFLYRIHEEPDAEKLTTLSTIASILGYEFQVSKAENRQYLQKFLASLTGKKHERLLNMLLLRTMKKARYSPHNLGHYGLALEKYAHFTSPIRRYPDLIVHRKLDAYILGGHGDDMNDLASYEELGDHLTEREIVTDSAERDCIKMKAAELMGMHLGEEFDGTISGVIPIGFFVELDVYFVEGLVHVASLTDDYYEVDRTGIILIGKNKGRKFMPGERVRVVVARTDKEHGEIDFVLVEKYGKKKK